MLSITLFSQYQFKPDKPWSDKPGKKAPKYRTAAGDEYDAILPRHPINPNYWLDIEKLKDQCYQINGYPMLLVTEGGFKAIALIQVHVLLWLENTNKD